MVEESRSSIDLLCEYIESGDIEKVREIVSSGIGLNATASRTGHSPLKTALLEDDISIASLLLTAGADPYYGKNELSPLLYAELNRLHDFHHMLSQVGQPPKGRPTDMPTP